MTYHKMNPNPEDDRMEAVDRAVQDLTLAVKHIGWKNFVDMLATPCGYQPGTCEKIAVIYWRRVLGLSLWHDGDKSAKSPPGRRSEERCRVKNP